MRTFEPKEVWDYIMGQPDERPVFMSQPEWNSPCGCVMVHLARDLGIRTPFFCGFSDVSHGTSNNLMEPEFTIGTSIHLYFVREAGKSILDFEGTYGELKAKLIHWRDVIT